MVAIERPDHLSQKKTFNLHFMPGFSPAGFKTVTSLPSNKPHHLHSSLLYGVQNLYRVLKDIRKPSVIARI